MASRRSSTIDLNPGELNGYLSGGCRYRKIFSFLLFLSCRSDNGDSTFTGMFRKKGKKCALLAYLMGLSIEMDMDHVSLSRVRLGLAHDLTLILGKVCEHINRLSYLHDLSASHQCNPVAYFAHEFHVMRDHDEGFIDIIAGMHDGMFDIYLGDRIHRARRLVQDHDFGFPDSIPVRVRPGGVRLPRVALATFRESLYSSPQ